MDQQYSTLELVRYDETARAPERDYDAIAFELDPSGLAPQTVPDITPQVLYDSSLPEAYGNEKSPTPSLHVIKSKFKRSWMIMALIIAVAIAVGVSVGIWHHREHSTPKSSSNISSPTPQNPRPATSPNITHAAQFILNDTSLAALSLPNGDRQLFFQDSTGLIRRAIRTTSSSQWSTSPYLNTSTTVNTSTAQYVNAPISPKNYTPLAVTVSINEVISAPESAQSLMIDMYSVSENHTLMWSTLIEGSWTPNSMLGNLSTAVDTRSLSIASIGSGSSDTNSTTNRAVLYYEDPTGKVSALLRRDNLTIFDGGRAVRYQWIDITSQESKSLPDEFRNIPGNSFSNTLYESDTNDTYSAPFTSGANFSDDSIGALFFSPSNSSLRSIPPIFGGSIVSTGYSIGASGPGHFISHPFPYPANLTSIHQSDIAVFGSFNAIWINGTQPIIVNPHDAEPDSVFPFARLASVTLADQSATFLYHQLNGTTFAEEQWDNSLNDWLPSEYITVSDL